jgi:hypothetical protein
VGRRGAAPGARVGVEARREPGTGCFSGAAAAAARPTPAAHVAPSQRQVAAWVSARWPLRLWRPPRPAGDAALPREPLRGALAARLGDAPLPAAPGRRRASPDLDGAPRSAPRQRCRAAPRAAAEPPRGARRCPAPLLSCPALAGTAREPRSPALSGSPRSRGAAAPPPASPASRPGTASRPSTAPAPAPPGAGAVSLDVIVLLSQLQVHNLPPPLARAWRGLFSRRGARALGAGLPR